MNRQRIPDEVLSAAHDRSKARAERDWATADRLRGEIEAAGWTIVDRGTDFALSPAAPADRDEGERVRYGASRNVPSRFDEPPVGLATVVLIATDWPTDVERAVGSLRATSPEGTSIVVVADGPSDESTSALDALADDGVDVVWTSERLGQGAATNIGLRRASAPVVVLMDTSIEPTGDVITPLVDALDDPAVAVAGGWGITSTDLRTFEDAPPGDVDAIEGYLLAFRRDDAAERGPARRTVPVLSEPRHLVEPRAARCRGRGTSRGVRSASPTSRPSRHEHRGWESLPEEERARQSKRNFYRIIDRFGSRRDLLLSEQKVR